MTDVDGDWHDVFAHLYSGESWDDDDDDSHVQRLTDIGPDLRQEDIGDVLAPSSAKRFSRKRLRAALDALSSAPEPEKPKRRRVITSFSSPPTLNNLAPRPHSAKPWTTTPIAPSQAEALKSFSTYSVPLYHKRLLTFGDPEFWRYDKPKELGAPEAARCGWISAAAGPSDATRQSGNTRGDMDSETADVKRKDMLDCLKCELCGVVWKADVDRSLFKEDFYRKAVKLMAEQLVLAHRDECLWRKHQCSDSIHRSLLLQHRPNPSVMAANAARMDTECLGSDPESLVRLGELSLTHPLREVECERLVANLRSASLADTTDQDITSHGHGHLSSNAAVLAFFGWKTFATDGSTSGTLEPHTDILYCHLCHRHLGLAPFRSPASKSQARKLDVVGSHKPFCPIRGFAEGEQTWWSGDSLLQSGGFVEGLLAKGGAADVRTKVRALLEGM